MTTMQRTNSPYAPVESDSEAVLQEFRSWMEQGLLPEMQPTRQKRSLQSALAMLEAGRTLLQDRSLEDLSIEAVCRTAGTAIGAFYGRFENKLAFFITMQRLQTIRSQSAYAGFAARDVEKAPDFEALCEEMVLLAVQNFRANHGLLRASLQHTNEGMWDVFKQSGNRYRLLLEKQFAPYVQAKSPEETRMRILFSYQAVIGVLVHATLNDPGPLGIDDEQLVPELTRLAAAYLRDTPLSSTTISRGSKAPRRR